MPAWVISSSIYEKKLTARTLAWTRRNRLLMHTELHLGSLVSVSTENSRLKIEVNGELAIILGSLPYNLPL